MASHEPPEETSRKPAAPAPVPSPVAVWAMIIPIALLGLVFLYELASRSGQRLLMLAFALVAAAALALPIVMAFGRRDVEPRREWPETRSRAPLLTVLSIVAILAVELVWMYASTREARPVNVPGSASTKAQSMYFWSVLTWLFFLALLVASRAGLSDLGARRDVPEEAARPFINGLRLLYGVAWGGLLIVTFLGILARPQQHPGIQRPPPKATQLKP
jgi:hypothetical protein